MSDEQIQQKSDELFMKFTQLNPAYESKAWKEIVPFAVGEMQKQYNAAIELEAAELNGRKQERDELKHQLSAAQAEVKRLKGSICEHCGSNHIRLNGCPRCGAPQCCDNCCQITTLEQKLTTTHNALREDRKLLQNIWDKNNYGYVEAFTWTRCNCCGGSAKGSTPCVAHYGECLQAKLELRLSAIDAVVGKENV